MNRLPTIEMSEINKHTVSSDCFANKLTITDVDYSATPGGYNTGSYSDPVRLNTLIISLVLQGTSEICLDYIRYELKANNFLTIMPNHIFQISKSSPDFKATMMIVDKSFLEECNTAKRSPSMTNYMLMRNNPCTELLPAESLQIHKGLQLLREKIRMRTHSFHKEVMHNAFVGFLLELGDVFVGKNDTFTRPTLSRKEELMNQFLQLLFDNAKDHHDVGFYAGKLFITPQYLSLILKELTGKSANKWIDEALLTEAKILLKMPQVTVQQVADQLNFSDQSTFGKFFKKHTQTSPMEFRKNT